MPESVAGQVHLLSGHKWPATVPGYTSLTLAGAWGRWLGLLIFVDTRRQGGRMTWEQHREGARTHEGAAARPAGIQSQIPPTTAHDLKERP